VRLQAMHGDLSFSVSLADAEGPGLLHACFFLHLHLCGSLIPMLTSPWRHDNTFLDLPSLDTLYCLCVQPRLCHTAQQMLPMIWIHTPCSADLLQLKSTRAQSPRRHPRWARSAARSACGRSAMHRTALHLQQPCARLRSVPPA